VDILRKICLADTARTYEYLVRYRLQMIIKNMGIVQSLEVISDNLDVYRIGS